MNYKAKIADFIRAGYWILLISFCSITSFSQEPIHSSFKIEDGLLSDETHFTLSDSKGYIWVASDAGINKFDGYTFKTFTEMDGLPESTVLRLYEDRKGRLWFSTLSSYIGYIENDFVHVTAFKFKEEVTTNNENFAYSIYVDEGDTLWVGTIFSGLLFKLAPPYTDEPIVKRFNSDFIIEFNKAGDYVYGTYSKPQSAKNELKYQNNWSGKTSTIKLESRDLQRRKNIVRIAEDHFIFESSNSIYAIKKGKVSLIHSFQNPIIFVSGNLKQGIWISVFNEGIYWLTDLKIESSTKPIFNDFSITSVNSDFEEGYWLTSIKDGLIYVPSLNFKALLKGKSYQDIYVQDDRNFIVNESQGDLVFYKNGNLDGINLSAYNVFQFQNDIYFTDPLKDQHFYSIKDGESIRVKINDPTKRVSSLKSFSNYESKILGWHNYLLFLKEEQQDQFNFLTALKSRINCAVMNKNNSIWIGTIDGLFHFDPTTGELTDYSKKHKLLGSRIDKIIIDESNNLWLATRGQGVILFSPDKKIKQITKKTGLPSDIIISFKTDERSNIWVGTNEGLCVIKQNKKHGITIDNFSYLNSYDLGTIHSTDVFDNDVYLATSKGVFVFPLDKLKEHSKVVRLPLYFTAVTTNKGRKIATFAKLHYNENSLKINFLGITFKHSKDIYYEYKLDGFHSKWFRTKNQSVELLNIPSGSYIFKVRAMTGGKILSQNQFSFNIEIPFWKSWWFYSLLIIFALALLFFIVRWRIRIIRKKEKERSDVEISFAHLESQALRAQMNPHFIFNSLNSIQRIYTEGNLKEANAYLSEFGQLIRKILENSGRTSISLKEEIETLELYLKLEQFRCKNKFSYTIEIDKAIDQYYLMIPSLIIQPFVENAIWHGVIPSEKQGLITISCEKIAEGIRVTVKDNGVGIQEPKKSRHVSKGIEITEKRIGSKIHISSTPREGTEVWFILNGYDD